VAAKDFSKLPYRPCVGVALFNKDGLVWVGRRIDAPGEAEGPGAWWQMPQGGVDEGEELYDAALRELYEETNVRSVEKIGALKDWLIYDLPPELLGKAWGGRYRGQKQKWFALRFVGRDSEIDIHKPGGGKSKPEFMDWRWERLARLPELIVPFKRGVYVEVAKGFAKLAR
jgi:putative (di)nucleoside polyphosphate hydrolase